MNTSFPDKIPDFLKCTFLMPVFLLGPAGADACTTCNKQLQAAIFDRTFYPNLLVLLSAFIVLAIIVLLLSVHAARKHNRRRQADLRLRDLSVVPLLNSAIVLGIGIGGFVDGILFHQILQWHQTLSAKIPADSLLHKNVNMFWDGIFHSFTLLTTVVGVYLLWRTSHHDKINKSGKVLAGGILTGWGIFNLVEGIIDHHLLRLHNVNELYGARSFWNLSFLGLGLLLIMLGQLLVRSGRKPKGMFGQYEIS